VNSTDQIWQSIKTYLKGNIDQARFTQWIEPLSIDNSRSSASALTVALPNPVYYQGLINEFADHFNKAKSALGLTQIDLRFEVGESVENLISLDGPGGMEIPECDIFPDEADAPRKQLLDDGASVPTTNEQPMQGANSAFSRALSRDVGLKTDYTFDNFVRGTSNQFAMATCMSVADNPGAAYNPLFIYGSTGLGKTHLLHAVGNRVLQKNPRAVVTYISSENFMNEMIHCLRHNKMWDFRQKYRFCDILMIDDIQFIANKKTTQEEFFHTFNTLYAAKKQIVLTSDLFPQDIPDIEDRLRNRFQWGLIADIQPPDLEHRIAILNKKAEQIGVTLAADVAEYIARHAKRNIRELEGALHRLHAFSNLHARPLNMELALETFKDVLGEPPKRLTVEHVLKTVADHFKLKVADLKSKRRQRAFAHPRQIAMYLARKMTGASFPEIGEKFGGKDHTTVMHNVKKIEESLARDLDLKAHVESLERQLEQVH
jgi:chromosomal replication initiator protein